MRTIAAHADTDCQRPPQWRHMNALCFHSQQNRDHGGSKRNVINQCGQNSRHPHQHQRCLQQIFLYKGDNELAQVLQKMAMFYSTDNDKQRYEEDEQRDLNFFHGMIHFHLAGDEHQ